MRTLAERFVWAREQAGLGKKEMADAIGVKAPSVTNIESGATKTLKAATLIGIQRATGVDAEWIVSGKGTPFPDRDSQDARIYTALQRLPPEYKARVEAEIVFLLELNELKP